MFENYVHIHKITRFINYAVQINEGWDAEYAHFICRREHKKAVDTIGRILTQK